jgi:hypothetical protein
METIYRVKSKDLLFKHDGSSSDPLTKKELRFLKSETDIILRTSANLNDDSKMTAQLFDTKAIFFGFMPLNR